MRRSIIASILILCMLFSTVSVFAAEGGFKTIATYEEVTDIDEMLKKAIKVDSKVVPLLDEKARSVEYLEIDTYEFTQKVKETYNEMEGIRKEYYVSSTFDVVQPQANEVTGYDSTNSYSFFVKLHYVKTVYDEHEHASYVTLTKVEGSHTALEDTGTVLVTAQSVFVHTRGVSAVLGPLAERERTYNLGTVSSWSKSLTNDFGDLEVMIGSDGMHTGAKYSYTLRRGSSSWSGYVQVFAN